MPKVKKHSLFPLGYDEISLVDEGAAGSADVLIMKRKSPVKGTKEPLRQKVTGSTKPLKTPKRSGGRSTENPCSDETNSTGAKTGNSSQRAKNWKEERHKRQKGGKFGASSSDSKGKYGKGGTTKSKLDAACRSKKNKRGVRGRVQPLTTLDSTMGVRKGAMNRLNSEIQLVEIMERKAAR